MIEKELQQVADAKKAVVLSRFFKTGKGEYGEGDIFIGVSVPDQRKIARKYMRSISLSQVEKLLQSSIHEYRFTALIILEKMFRDGRCEAVFDLCMKNVKWINNWDLVDLGAPSIIGPWVYEKKKWSILKEYARSGDLWKNRIAMVATYAGIRMDNFTQTMRIVKILLPHEHDLIHKAIGWMLREVWKRDALLVEDFLKKNYDNIPRTTLRYAIEKFPKDKYERFLKGDVCGGN